MHNQKTSTAIDVYCSQKGVEHEDPVEGSTKQATEHNTHQLTSFLLMQVKQVLIVEQRALSSG